MRTTVLSYLDDFIARGDEIAFAHRRGLRIARWSYQQIARTAFQFSRELEARAVGKGDRVLLWAENSPEWVVSFLGCALRGSIVVPLDMQSDGNFVARVQNQVGAKLLVCSAETRSFANLNIPTLELEQINSLLAPHSPEPYSTSNVDEDDDVEIVFTSGTTAEPKGVRITHRNLLANLVPLERKINPFLKWERLVHPLRFLNLVPLSHVFGQLMGIFVPQLLGGEVFFQTSLNPSQIMWTTRRERISVMVTVPRLLETLRDKMERDWAARGEDDKFRRALASSVDWHFLRRWWAFRSVHRRVGWEVSGLVPGGATPSTETETRCLRPGAGRPR